MADATADNRLADSVVLCAVHSTSFVKKNRQYLDMLRDSWKGHHHEILRCALVHVDVYNEAAGPHINEYFTGADAELGLRLALASSAESYAQVGERYVSSKLKSYVEQQEMIQIALPRAAKAFHKGDMIGGWEALHASKKKLAVSGYDMIDAQSVDLLGLLDELYSEEAMGHLREMSYGIEALDFIGSRPTRGTTGGWLAPPGVGKTWHGCHMSAVNALRGKRVLYVNLEGEGKDIMGRIVHIATGLDYTKGKSEITCIEKDADFYMTGGFRREVLAKGKKVTELSPEEREDMQYKLKSLNIKTLTFSPGTLTGEVLDDAVASLADGGWVPDLIVLDHLKFMRLVESVQGGVREALEAHNIRFLQIAIRYNCSFEFFHQPAGYGDVDISRTPLTFSANAAGAKSLLEPISRALTIQCTPQESKLGLLRIWVDKLRTKLEEGRVGVMVVTTNNTKRARIGHSSCILRSVGVDKAALAAL